MKRYSSFHQSVHSNRTAFTLIELLVVIAIIAIMVAILLPAVQQAREAARRMNCKNNLAELALAVHNYDLLYGTFPIGSANPTGPIVNIPQGTHYGWLLALTPFYEQTVLDETYDKTVGVYHPRNQQVRQTSITILLCPSDPADAVITPGNGPRIALTNYAGCHHDKEMPIDTDNHGVFMLNRAIDYDGIADGTSNTLMLGEKVREQDPLGWVSGTKASLRNTGAMINSMVNPFPFSPEELDEIEEATEDQQGEAGDAGGQNINPALLSVGGFGSYHAGGANFVLCDGAVRFMSENLDPDIYSFVANRGDGQILGDF